MKPWLAWLGWAWALPALAQPAGAALDIENAVAHALSRHPAVAAAQAGALGALAQVDSTARLNAPVLKLSVDRDEATGDAPNTPARKKLGVEWEPPQWGESGLRRQQLQQGSRQQGHRLEQARQQVALEVRRAHLGLAWLGEMVEASEQLRRLAQAWVGRAQEQAQLGRRNQQALLELRVQALEMDSQHQALVLQRSQQEAALRSLLGLQPLDALAVARPATLPAGARVPVPQGGEGVEVALRQRPELKAAQARCQAVQADARLKDMDNQRWVKSVGLDHTLRRTGKPAAWGMALEINLPVTGAKNGSTVALQAAVTACEAEAQDLEWTIRREVLLAAQQWQAAARELQQLDGQALPLVRQQLELAQGARKAGRSDALDVLAAEMAQTRAQIAALRRQLELRWAELAWQHATGQPLAAAVAEPPARPAIGG